MDKEQKCIQTVRQIKPGQILFYNGKRKTVKKTWIRWHDCGGFYTLEIQFEENPSRVYQITESTSLYILNTL